MPRLKIAGNTKQKKRCNPSRSFPCGYSCQAIGRNCRKPLKGQGKNSQEWLRMQSERLDGVNRYLEQRRKRGIGSVVAPPVEPDLNAPQSEWERYEKEFDAYWGKDDLAPVLGKTKSIEQQKQERLQQRKKEERELFKKLPPAVRRAVFDNVDRTRDRSLGGYRDGGKDDGIDYDWNTYKAFLEDNKPRGMDSRSVDKRKRENRRILALYTKRVEEELSRVEAQKMKSSKDAWDAIKQMGKTTT